MRVVDVTQSAAAPLVDGAGPLRKHGDAEAVDTNITDVPLLDQPDPATLAVPAAGPRVEIAGTAKIAVAGDQDASVHSPFSHASFLIPR